MGYFLDPRKSDPQDEISVDVLLRADEKTLKALKAFNKHLLPDLRFIFAQDLGRLHIPNVMQSAIKGVSAARRRGLVWEVRVDARMLNYRTSYFVLSASSLDGINMEDADLAEQPDCPMCFGIGSLRKVIREGQSPTDSMQPLSSTEMKRLLPRAIIRAHEQSAARIDEMRGQEVFDDILKAIEKQQLALRRSIWHFAISIQSRIILPKMTIQASLGSIRLAPLLRVGRNSMPASSRWEAERLCGKPLPSEVLFFEACPGCQGTGASSSSAVGS